MLRAEEHELVRRTLDGDSEAFGFVYRTYRSRVYATVRGRTGDAEEAEDLVQVTFMRAFLGLEGFRGEAALSTWLTQIAINVCTTYFRAQRARRARLDRVEDPGSDLLETWQPSRVEGPDEVLHQKQSRDLLTEGIADLPTPYREAMSLRYIEDLSYLEITERLRVPIGTVKSWLYRGREQLRDRIEDRVVGAM